MKKLLLSGAALVAMAATPAMAEGLSLDLSGHFKGYGVYTDAENNDTREFNFRKETEVHFTGETTLDSGLTVGVHVEMNVDTDEVNSEVTATTGTTTDSNGDTTANAVTGITSTSSNRTIEESYMYLSGGWGRVNFGEEDGAAYLLQVAAPSADANIDGLRQYISTSVEGRLDYDQATSGTSNKLTYMTPVFNGFQAGVSYVPTVDDAANGTVAAADETDGGLSDGYELAARYEGEFEGVGVTVGAGFGDYDGETATDDRDAWNAGLDLDFSGVGFGVSYLEEEVASDTDREVLVVGADYEMGAYKLGATWLNQDGDTGVDELDRYTVGASYAYGPGMSFRGAVSVIDNDTDSSDETQVTLGTQVKF